MSPLTSLDDWPEMLSVEETARILRISRGSAYEAVRVGQIPSLQFGRRRVIPKRALMKMIDDLTRSEVDVSK